LWQRSSKHADNAKKLQDIAPHQLARHIRCLTLIIEAVDAGAMAEVGPDTDVIDADALDEMSIARTR
jgi:hypothetical protein